MTRAPNHPVPADSHPSAARNVPAGPRSAAGHNVAAGPRAGRPGTHRVRAAGRAFTLAELLVAVAIMAALMTLIATVFATASKASGTAQAIAAAHRQQSQTTQSIRRDLEAIVPGPVAAGAMPPMLAIAGVEVAAQETPAAAPLLHRADVLMLLMPAGQRRDFAPYVYSGTTAYQARQVVYGHADTGKRNAAGNWDPNFLRSIDTAGQQPVAAEWHLARRVIGIPSAIPPAGPGAAGGALTATAFLTGEADVYSFNPQMNPALNPPANPPLGFFRFDGAATDPVQAYYHAPVAAGENHYFAKRGAEHYLLANGYWWGRTGANAYVRLEAGNIIPPLMITNDFTLNNSWKPFPSQWFYAPGSRTIIDPAPLPGHTTAAAWHFLPRCSYFKVEFTYDNPYEVTLDRSQSPPEITFTGCDDTGTLLCPAPVPVRWQSVPAGEIWVWSGLSVDPNDYAGANPVDKRDLTHPFRWPRAIRITLRSYAGGQEQPIQQTIVHAWKN